MLHRAGSLLKSQIPSGTRPTGTRPCSGFGEIDLVGHGGGDNNGDFACSLTVTDVATGWSEAHNVRNKPPGPRSALWWRFRPHSPFPLLGNDADNGSEFVNHTGCAGCTDQQIAFPRSRRANSNERLQRRAGAADAEFHPARRSSCDTTQPTPYRLKTW